MTVEFGLFLPQIRMDPATIEARARAAEELGFDSVWFVDHLAPPGGPEHPMLDGWTTASFLAARTERIRLGHMVLCDAFHHPAVLAKMAATLDVFSGGRLSLGLGWGSVAEELRAWGVTTAGAAERAARLGETLEVLTALFTGEPVTYAGTYHRLDGVRALPRPSAIPIHLGGAGARLTMPLVRRFADWWNCPSYAVARLDELRPLAGAARVSTQHPIGLAAASRQRDDVAVIATRRFGSWGGLITGTPDQVAQALAADVRRGVEGFVLQFFDFGQRETLSLFMNEVVPQVRAAAAATILTPGEGPAAARR